MKRVISIALCMLLASTMCAARFVDNDVRFETFSARSLPSNYVKCVYQDSEGFIWIATNNGLVRYDGRNCLSYAEHLDKYTFIYEIVEDSEGILLATDKGLVCLDKSTGSTSVRIEDSTVSTVVRDSRGNIWAGGGNGLYMKEDGSETFVKKNVYYQDKPLNGIIDLMVTADGNVWMTTWRKGLYVYEPDTDVVKVFNKNLLAYSYVLHEDSDGNVWTGTWGYGLLRLDRDFITTASYKAYPVVSSDGHTLVDDVIYAINDHNGYLLVGGQKGYAVMDIESGSSCFHTPGVGNDSLPYNQVNSILVTSNDNVYLGLYGGGMCRVDYQEKPYQITDLRHRTRVLGTNTVHSICEADENHLWLGIPDHAFGLFDLESHNVSEYDEISHFNGIKSISTVFAISRRAGSEQVCFGTYSEGLWIYDPVKGKVRVISSETCPVMKNNNILSLKNDSAGNMWIGTNKGVYILTGDDRVLALEDVVRPVQDNLVNDAVNHISSGSDGAIYLATATTGIVRADMVDSTLMTYPAAGGNVPFTNVCLDDNGKLWAGSFGDGLYLLDEEDGQMKQMNPVHDLLSDYVTNLMQLPDGQMLMTTSNEVVTFSYSEEKGISVVGYIQCLDFDFSRNVSLLKGDDLLIGSTRGLFSLPLQGCQAPHGQKSTIAITDVIINGQSYRDLDILDSDINYVDQIKVRRGDNVEIRFILLDHCPYHLPVYSYSYGDKQGRTVKGSVSFTVSQPKTVVRIGHDQSGQTRELVVLAPYISFFLYIVIIGAVLILLSVFFVRFSLKSKKSKEDVIAFEINSIKFTSQDQTFLQQAMKIINSNISNSEFKQEDFIRQMGISRTLLTERLKALTGFTPVSLIMEIRLKTAYTSIMESDGRLRVSDIAYSVGFNDAKYFSTCFRKRYGLTPKELIKQRLENISGGGR